MEAVSFGKLTALNNKEVNAFSTQDIALCQPVKVWAGDDSDADSAFRIITSGGASLTI